MAKKYLLYIHDNRFADVAKKSNLVNDLLTEHYMKTTGTAIKKMNPEIWRSGKIGKIEGEPVLIEPCRGHPLWKENCGKPGCKYV